MTMNILTFDIEEWFHSDFISGSGNWDNYEARIYNDIDRVLEALDKKKQKATFFCLGWIALKHPQVIKRIHARGHQIGCHSDMHELVFRFNKLQFSKDTETAIKRIEDLTGDKINLYRAPGFSITEKNPWAFEVLAENGIEFDCSIFPSNREYGGFPSFGNSEPSIIDVHGYFMKEFPINIVKIMGKEIIFSGGGFFRLLPYSLIHYWMKKSDYVMTYFHPRDFDAKLPMLHHLPLHRKFKSYVGLRKSFTKFKRLLNDFEFVNIEQADQLINWDKARTIKLF
jgi:polysaccharide deacetylase family protein (PEP-CTERM system associated)